MTSRFLTSPLLIIFLFSNVTAQAQTLRFAWPDGATANVQTRTTELQARRKAFSEEMTKTYTFAWVPPAEKKG